MSALACSQAHTPVSPAAGSETGRETTAEPESDTVSVEELGRQPRAELKYALSGGSLNLFRVSQELSLIESGRNVGRVTLEAPLEVMVLSTSGARFTLQLQLGPPAVSRVGDTNGIEFARDLETVGPSSVATAEVVVDKRGNTLRHVALASAWQPVLETLTGFGGLPVQPLGVGARWQTRRAGADGAITESSYELLAREDEVVTLRVWRTQFSAAPEARQTRSMGEWTFRSQQWPMTGADRINLSVPHAKSKLFSASFKIERQPEP